MRACIGCAATGGAAGRLTGHMHAVQVLNKLLGHAGLQSAQPFTPQMVKGHHGFMGRYSKNFTADEREALDLLREYFRKPQEDLQMLVDMLYPDLNFTVALES